MQVLTVRQPWAQAMFITDARRKNVENRTWCPPAATRVAIHAGQRLDLQGIEDLELDRSWIRDLGVVIGTVEIVSWHHQGRGCDEYRCRSNRWAKFGDVAHTQLPMVHWMLARPQLFVTPIKASGKLGLWEPGPSLAHLISIAEVHS